MSGMVAGAATRRRDAGHDTLGPSAARRPSRRALGGRPGPAGGALANPELLQDDLGGAEAGEGALQQVRADERREPEPARIVEERAAGGAEGEGDQHEGAGEDADGALEGHVGLQRAWPAS